MTCPDSREKGPLSSVAVWGRSVIFQVDLLPLLGASVPYRGYVTCICGGSVAANILFLNTTLMQGFFLDVYLMFDIAYQIQSGDSAGMAWYCPITHLTFTNIDLSWVCPGLGLFRTVCHYSVMESVQM